MQFAIQEYSVIRETTPSLSFGTGNYQYEKTIGRKQTQSPTVSSSDIAGFFELTLALVTATTEAIMMALPASMYLSTLSCSTSHPRNTATIGFTYAYVETFDVGACPRSQM
jgi:hypothetical protein